MEILSNSNSKPDKAKNKEANSLAWEAYQKSFSYPEDGFEELLATIRAGNVHKFLTILQNSHIYQKNEKGYSALMIASYNNQLEIAKLLLDVGADPNSIDQAGNSILMGASFKGYSEMIQLLISYGADPHYISPKGQNALQMATMFGRKEVLEILQPDQNPRTKDRILSWFQYLFSFIPKEDSFKANKEAIK